MKHQIKHRQTDAVLFECEVPDMVASGMATRHALEQATKAGAYLDGANLDGANLDGELKLIGGRPVFQVGPIGSRCSIFTAYITNQGLRVTAGCFKQKTVEEFRVKLIEEHDTNKHRLEYEAALTMIEVHAEIWTPKEQA